MPASRTAETLRPAQRGQIVATGPFAGEACLELEQVAWIILHEGAYYILGSPESSGYPISFDYSRYTLRATFTTLEDLSAINRLRAGATILHSLVRGAGASGIHPVTDSLKGLG